MGKLKSATGLMGLIVVGAVILQTIGFQNCSGFSNSYPAARRQVISTPTFFQTPQLNAATGGQANSEENEGPVTNGTVGSATPTPTPAPTATPAAGPPEQKVTLVCTSSQEKGAVGGNVAGTAVLTVKVLNANRQQICEFTKEDAKNHLVTHHGFHNSYLLKHCPGIQAADIKGVRILNGSQSLDSRAPKVPGTVLDFNPPKTFKPSDCDASFSPLVIRMARNPEPLILSPIEQGFWFDLLGINATPVPHTPVLISKIMSNDTYFISLPNQNGEVLGIDELFGDNTVGPDGLTADNGYLSLAKWDSNHDAFITRKDPVFTRLRLWKDLNFNGRSESIELINLTEAGIASIDLNYDGDYFERDQYGNQIRMKSVAGMRDGSLRLVFDLWFRLMQ